MKPNSAFSDTLIIKYDDNLQSLLIIHPDKNVRSSPIARIRAETLATMNFQEASKFIGSSLVIMIPQLREFYKEELHIEDMERHLEDRERFSRGKSQD